MINNNQIKMISIIHKKSLSKIMIPINTTITIIKTSQHIEKLPKEDKHNKKKLSYFNSSKILLK